MKLGTPGFVGASLREAREARGITAIALAEDLGISRAAVSQYEADQQSPRPEVMEQIAARLRLPLRFFMQKHAPDVDSLIFWRSVSTATKSARTRVRRRLKWLRSIAIYLREYVEFPPVDQIGRAHV